jgi:hypothetical protein
MKPDVGDVEEPVDRDLSYAISPAQLSDVLAEHHVLSTRLTPAECEARLRARAASWPMWRPSAKHPVAGRVSSSGFSLTKAINYRNSFQTEARGTFSSFEHGTRIRLTLGPAPLVLVFGLVWILFAVGVLITGAASDFPVVVSNGFPPAVIPFAILAFGLALVGVGRLLARGEGAFLLQFLLTELEAEEVLG